MSDSKQKLTKFLFESWKLWSETKEKEEEKVQTLDFSEFSFEDLQKAMMDVQNFQKTIKSNPEIEKNIKDSKKITLKNSKLLFDGQKLHWLTQGKVFKSWPATSGHYQDLILSEESLEISLAIMKILKYAEGKDLFDLKSEISVKISGIRREWHGVSGRAGAVVRPTEVLDLVDSFWEVDYIQRFRLMSKPLEKKKPKTDSKLFIGALGKILDRLGLSSVSASDINAASRQKRTGESDIGPIPEGIYKIKHKLQEAPLKAAPDAYISLLAAIKLFQKAYEVEWTPEQKALAKELIPDQSLIKPGGRTSESFGAVNLALDFVTGRQVPESASLLSTIPWGNYRISISKVPAGAAELSKEAQKAYKKRFGFYIHGGALPGSSGCIDLGHHMDDFAQFWSTAGVTEIVKSSARGAGKKPSGIEIPLEVKYLDEEKRKLLQKNKIAKKYDYIVFSPE